MLVDPKGAGWCTLFKFEARHRGGGNVPERTVAGAHPIPGHRLDIEPPHHVPYAHQTDQRESADQNVSKHGLAPLPRDAGLGPLLHAAWSCTSRATRPSEYSGKDLQDSKAQLATVLRRYVAVPKR